MKYKKLLIGVIIIIIILALSMNYFYLPDSSEDKPSKPQARIDIKKVVAGEIVINQGEIVFFTGVNSTDNDGKIENYYWDFDDGNSSSEVEPVHSYEDPGLYYVTLTVTDNDGNKNVTSIQITVLNNLPIAKIQIENYLTPSSTGIPIFTTLQFNSTDSYDSDGPIIGWNWDFGDGNVSSEQNPKHTYSDIGIYTVILTIKDEDNGIAEDSLDLEIILRTYKIEWTIEETEIIINSNGYTREGESSEEIGEVTQDQISSVITYLNWTDRQPYLEDNSSIGEDTFELKVITPENVSKTQNSTTGLVSILFEYIPQLSDKVYQAKTANDAIDKAMNYAGFAGNGKGEWKFNISALKCKGGSWSNENFDFDIGNFWSLKINIFYYSIDITDISFEE
jgi:PKD repeat protein